MSMTDKLKHSAEKLTGEVKEHIGKAKGDKDLEAEGKTDQASGSIKNAGENVKDAFKS